MVCLSWLLCCRLVCDRCCINWLSLLIDLLESWLWLVLMMFRVWLMVLVNWVCLVCLKCLV